MRTSTASAILEGRTKCDATNDYLFSPRNAGEWFGRGGHRNLLSSQHNSIPLRFERAPALSNGAGYPSMRTISTAPEIDPASAPSGFTLTGWHIGSSWASRREMRASSRSSSLPSLASSQRRAMRRAFRSRGRAHSCGSTLVWEGGERELTLIFRVARFSARCLSLAGVFVESGSEIVYLLPRRGN
jgi:hypothetical protein